MNLLSSERAIGPKIGKDLDTANCWKSFSALDVWGLLELRGWCYHGNDGAKRAVWMYLVFSVRRASSVLYSYNIHSN